MKQLVSINLTTRTAKDWTPPTLTFGESLTLALRFTKNSGGLEIDAPLDVSSLKASIGAVDERPAGGTFAIKIGNSPADADNTSSALVFNTSANNLADQLNAVAAHAPYGTARVVAADGSWLIFFGDESVQVPLTVVNNGLWPVSFGRINAWQVDGKWVHELRLTQAPVAFTSSHDVVLPPQPEITRIQGGGAETSYSWNEIQQLYVPPEFIGAYIIKRGYGKTVQLSRDDGIDAIETALQVLGTDCWKVTLPLSNKVSIEFVGDYAGLSQDLLVTQVEQAPAGDLTFTLALDRAELAAMLRRDAAVTLPLEIRVAGTDDGGFSGEICALVLDVTINRPVTWPDLEEWPTIDWLRPLSPKTYVPFGSDNVLTGQRFYQQVVGDGEVTEWAIATGLGSEAVFVFGRENHSGGRQLVDGTDFRATIDSGNQVTVTALTGAPATGAWVFLVIAAQSVASWANDLTVTVPQVVTGGGYPSLAAFMDDIGSRVTTLETILPSVGPAAVATQASGIVIQLLPTSHLMFWKGAAADEAAAFAKDGVVTARAPMMLPAVHDASATVYPSGDLPTPEVGGLWQNTTGSTIDLGRGVRGGRVLEDGFFGSDGRALYAVDRAGATNSYFPTGFEHELFRIFVNERMLRLKRTLDVQFGLGLRLINATSNAQWTLVIERGTAPSQVSPATTAMNLENIEWEAVPCLSQRLILTQNRQTHGFGCRINRALALVGSSYVDTITMDTMSYGVWDGANSLAPTDANFALRARLVQFDTENALASDARGWLAVELIGPSDDVPDPQAKIS